MKSRVLYIDVIRVVACLMVVLMHSMMPTDTLNSTIASTLSYLTSPCIGLFFMISGAMLLPNRQRPVTFMKHRLGKVGGPLLIWALAYLAIYKFIMGLNVTWIDALSLPFSNQSCGILWFMYTLVGLYLIVPLVSPFIDSCEWSDIKPYLFLFILVFCYPIIGRFLKVDTSDESYVYYFAGYGGYFFIGWMMRRFPERFGLPILTLGFAVSIAAVIVCRLAGWEVDFYTMFWYQSIFVVMMAMFWFKVIQKLAPYYERISTSSRRLLVMTSNFCFGIYLIHFGIIRYWLVTLPIFTNINNYILQTSALFITGFAVSWVLSYLISRLPFSKYIIGT